jgi:cell division protein FtsQ
MNSINWKKRLEQIFWILIGIGTVVLLGAAMQKKDKKACSDVEIEISGAEKEVFIDKNDVMDLLNSNGAIVGKPIGQIDLRALESAIEKNKWVKNADMFFDNSQLLKVRIEEREPIARIFTANGNSFYVDSTGFRLPLSDKLSARVPMVTNFPSDRDMLALSDSSMLMNVVRLGKFVLADSFRMAQVAQIDILPNANFEIIPTWGNQTIELGDAGDLENKFNRLNTFYKNAWLQNGINTYEKLMIQYDNQVVGIRRGAAKAVSDSVKLNKIMSSQLLLNKDSTRLNAIVIKPKPTIKDSVALAGKTNKKSLVGVKQNKVTNKSLSNGRSGLKAQQKPVLKRQPKAVMQKAE